MYLCMVTITSNEPPMAGSMLSITSSTNKAQNIRSGSSGVQKKYPPTCHTEDLSSWKILDPDLYIPVKTTLNWYDVAQTNHCFILWTVSMHIVSHWKKCPRLPYPCPSGYHQFAHNFIETMLPQPPRPWIFLVSWIFSLSQPV